MKSTQKNRAYSTQISGESTTSPISRVRKMRFTKIEDLFAEAAMESKTQSSSPPVHEPSEFFTARDYYMDQDDELSFGSPSV